RACVCQQQEADPGLSPELSYTASLDTTCEKDPSSLTVHSRDSQPGVRWKAGIFWIRERERSRKNTKRNG
ncbi:hypothetical protein ABG768_027335, partial [Culter alburnus]